MAGKYKIEFGAKHDRKVKIGLRQAEVIPAYDRLKAAGEDAISIISPTGEKLDPHQFRLDVTRTGWGR